MYEELIDYFHKGIETSTYVEKVDFVDINSKALPLGYVIHPDCCNIYVYNWLDTLTANYNATFYKEWNDIINRNRMELFVDQLMHYATTYGTDFELGNGYVPNDGSTSPSFAELKVIGPISETALHNRCMDILSSGVALKTKTATALVEFVDFFSKKMNFDDGMNINLLNHIKNKEAQAMLSLKFDLLPRDEFGLLRCLVYRFTNSTTLIKDDATTNLIAYAAKTHARKSPLLSLTTEQKVALSRIFHRFKPLFLAMKSGDGDVNRVVNEIRRLAKKNHRPFHIGFWESVIVDKKPIQEVCRRLSELDNFRKVRLLMLIKERIMFKTETGVFQIRNGKMYVRNDYHPNYDLEYLGTLFLAVKASLVNSLAKKACKVKFPEGLSIALPSSEKTFVGNYPFGSSFQLSRNNVVGVYWRNEWGAMDYDLSMADVNGKLISWRCNYKNKDGSVLYSGDMTCAEPEAVELLYIKDSSPDGMIMLNKYNGTEKSKFRFFYANEVVDAKKMYNHMVDPNNIKVDAMMDFDGHGQKTIGMIRDNKFFFMDFGSGHRRVSNGGNYINTIVESMNHKIKSAIGLKDILTEAGFEEVKDGETPDIDFTNLEKDTLVNLMSKND